MTGLHPETLRMWGEEAQDFQISEERAIAIAKIIQPQADIARSSTQVLAFDSEPADFVRALHRWRGPRK